MTRYTPFTRPSALRALAALALCIAFTQAARAQISLNLTGADPSGYPTIKIFFEARDRNNAYIGSFVPSDFTVVEDGITRPVLSVSCPPPSTPPLSLTITVDVSYSMSIAGRLNNAKVAATTLVRSLNFPPARIGITTFDDTSHIKLPFSSDTTAIQTAITDLRTNMGGGTDFLGACLDAVTGALDFTRNQPGDRYIIFITDGAQNLLLAQEQQIIAAAVASNLRIYTVTLSPNIQNFSLRRIAIGTGGLWFENVTTEQAAKDAFKQIGDRIYTYYPCQLTYQTTGCETRRNVDVTLRKFTSTATKSLQYLVPAGSIVSLDASNTLLDFGTVPGGGSRTLSVSLAAINGPVNVTSINTTNPAYRVTSYGGTAPPFTINANASRTLSVQYTAPDTSRIIAMLNVQCDAPCVEPPVLAGGAYRPDALRLVQPNGGEQLWVGSTYMIRWAGVPPLQQVILEYSTDAGGSWYQISPNAYSLAVNWTVPNTPSNTCLGLVRTPEKRNAPRDILWMPWQPEEVTDLDIAAGGTVCASAQADGHVKLFAPDNGTLLDILDAHTGRATAVAFSPDGTLLASGGSDGHVKIWSSATGALVRDITAHTGQVHSLAFSRDGAYLATADQNAVILWRSSDWGQQWRRNGMTSADAALCVHPSNAWVAAGSGNQIHILNGSDGATLRTLSGHSGAVRAMSVTAGGQLLASGSDDRSIRLWTTATWQNDRTLSGHTGGVTSVQLSPSGLYLLSASRDRSVRVWDTRKAAITQTFSSHTLDVNAARTDPRSGLTLSGGLDKTIRAWGYSLPLDDASDSLWAIIAPSTTLQVDPPSFAPVLCPDEYSESDILLKNTGNQPLTIQSATFSGSPAFAFSPGFGIPPARVLQPEDTLRLRLRFAPITPGDHQGNVSFATDAPSLPTLDVPLLGHKDSVGFLTAPDTLDAGEIYTCTLPAVLPLELINTGTVNLRIDSLDASFPGALHTTPTLPHPLMSGELDTISVSLSPSAFGPFNGSITIGAQTCSIRKTVYIRGTLLPTRPIVRPSPVVFGFTSVGDTGVQTAYVRNPTKVPMTIESVTAADPVFTITSPSAWPVVIPPLDSIPVALAFLPVSEGTFTSTLTATASSPCPDSASVQLEGVSARKPAIAFQGGDFERLLCSDIRFTDSVVVLRNTGGVPLLVSNMTIGGTNPSDFLILSATSGSINPNDSLRVVLRFQPTGTGLRTAMLTVTNNSAQQPQLNIALAGVKDSAGFVMEPTSFDAGTLHSCELPAGRTVTFRNTGTIPLLIDALPATIPAFARFGSSFPISVPAGDTAFVQVFLEPAQNGSFTGAITFRGTPCDAGATLDVAARLEPSTPLLRPAPMDFGTNGVGTVVTRRAFIVNPASVPMRVDSVSMDPPGTFMRRLQPSSLPATIAGGDSLLVEYEYAPLADESISSMIRIHTDLPCSDSASIPALAVCVGAVSEISLPVFSAEVGSIVRIPLTLVSSANLSLTNTRSFRAGIRWNRSMLWPLGVSSATGAATMSSAGSADTLLLTIEVQQSATPQNGVLAEIECLVLLGNADSTALAFSTFSWLNGVASVNTRDGAFTTLGICQEGGKRLMALPGSPMLMQNTPNPFNPETVVEFSLPEAMDAEVLVFDAVGQQIRVLASGPHDQGLHRVIFNATALPSGVYYCTLRAGGRAQTRAMLLAK